MRDSLLDPEFVRELEALRRRLAIRARSGALGERAASRRGGAADFEEHRPYVPGDDLRHLDWLAYARTGEAMLKLYRPEEDALLRLLLDASASLSYGDPPKLQVARRLAAAIGYLALAGSQRAQVLVAQPRSDASAAGPTGLGSGNAPRRGRAGLARLLEDLSVEPRGTVDLSRAINQVVDQSVRPGMLVVLSDFLDRGPVIRALGRARSAGHDVALLQVVARSEIDPGLEGDLSLVDSETGARVEVTVDATVTRAYVLRFAGLVEELRAWARRHGATYVFCPTDEPLQLPISRFVQRTID
jgi:uncharacterized protein (DUF58 family)